MPSEKYRYCCLDNSGRLHDAVWFLAESDEAAIARVEAQHPADTCEVWHGKRLVATLRPVASPIVCRSGRGPSIYADATTYNAIQMR